VNDFFANFVAICNTQLNFCSVVFVVFLKFIVVIYFATSLMNKDEHIKRPLFYQVMTAFTRCRF